MKLPDIQNNNLTSFLNRAEIITETADQIMKDFGMFGIEITFSGNIENAYQELLAQLVNQISTYLTLDHGRLMSVLYQVDISDRDIEKTSHELPHYNQLEVLAHQVIFRELKKVLFRRYYKETNNT